MKKKKTIEKKLRESKKHQNLCDYNNGFYEALKWVLEPEISLQENLDGEVSFV